MQNYAVEEQIGSGKFGKVYRGFNKINKTKVAIKIDAGFSILRNLSEESPNQKINFTLLKNEATIINYLSLKKCNFIPKVYWYGKTNVLNLPFYDTEINKLKKFPETNCRKRPTGENAFEIKDEFIEPKYIESLNFKLCLIETFYDGGSLFEKATGFTFCSEESISYINLLMRRMITIIKDVHNSGVIHRDIKPHNFMFSGNIKNGELYLIDFGLATFVSSDIRGTGENEEFIGTRCIKNTETIVEKPFEVCKTVECNTFSKLESIQNEDENLPYLVGTPNYISYFIHEGQIPSKRDDLISIGYIYLFLLCKRLLWEESLQELSEKIYNEFAVACEGKLRDSLERSVEKEQVSSNQRIKRLKEINFLKYIFINSPLFSALFPSKLLKPLYSVPINSSSSTILRKSENVPIIIKYFEYLYNVNLKCKINYDELINLFRT